MKKLIDFKKVASATKRQCNNSDRLGKVISWMSSESNNKDYQYSKWIDGDIIEYARDYYTIECFQKNFPDVEIRENELKNLLFFEISQGKAVFMINQIPVMALPLDFVEGIEVNSSLWVDIKELNSFLTENMTKKIRPQFSADIYDWAL